MNATTPAPPPYRSLQPGQVSQLTIVDRDGRNARIVHETDQLIEAPNWTSDGRSLIYNARGALYRLAADGAGAPEKIDVGPIDDANNDHVLAPDGRTIYISSRDGHLYAAPVAGGARRRITNEHPPERPRRHFLHGVSPDGTTLAYVGVEPARGDPSALKNIFTIPAAGGVDRQLTRGDARMDGPEFSPDGAWIYFNGQPDANAPELQIWRMRPDGSGREQLTRDARSNWFPHPAPDMSCFVYVSFPPGTVGHPPDKDVILRVAALDGTGSRDIVALFGGQGTLNVNSWAPDSRRFAYVAYPRR
jgi:Tol biopolymer transport system component